MTRKTLFWIWAIVIAFQLLTLNLGIINGDEAIYVLILKEIGKVASGTPPLLNPIIGYAGPLDFWLLGSVYALLHQFSTWTGPYLVRIVPLGIVTLSIVAAYREIQRDDHLKAANIDVWFLFLSAISPMVLVFERVAWPPSLLLGFCFLFLAESLRMNRTLEVRWLYLATVFGIATEMHPIAWVAIPVLMIPNLNLIVRKSKKAQSKVFASFLLFLLFAAPVLKNFPLPLDGGNQFKPDFRAELAHFLNMVSGRQSLLWLHGYDVRSEIFPLLLLIIVAVLFVSLTVRVIKSRSPEERYIGLSYLAHAAATVFMLWMTYRGRSLRVLGDERYFLGLVPGWLFLFANGLSKLIETVSGRFSHFKFQTEIVVALILLSLTFPSHALPLMAKVFNNEHDPYYQVAQFLETQCPKNSCLAYTENFWMYWPVRYYTGDRIDVNYLTHNWHAEPKINPNDRYTIHCLYKDSAQLRVLTRFSNLTMNFDEDQLGVEIPVKITCVELPPTPQIMLTENNTHD